LFSQEIFSALLRAAESAGRSNPARIAMMAITTSSSIKVNECAVDKENFLFMGKEGFLFPLRPLSLSKKRELLCFVLYVDLFVKKCHDEITVLTSSSIRVNGTLEKQYRREESDCITSEMRHSERKSVDFVIGLIIFSPVLLFFYS
jgi:hypothetical protein